MVSRAPTPSDESSRRFHLRTSTKLSFAGCVRSWASWRDRRSPSTARHFAERSRALVSKAPSISCMCGPPKRGSCSRKPQPMGLALNCQQRSSCCGRSIWLARRSLRTRISALLSLRRRFGTEADTTCWRSRERGAFHRFVEARFEEEREAGYAATQVAVEEGRAHGRDEVRVVRAMPIGQLPEHLRAPW